MIGLQIRTDIRDLVKYYQDMAARARDASSYTGDPAGSFATALSDISAEQFASEGTYLNGAPWAPWTESTIRLQAYKPGRRGGILEDTGALVDTLAYMRGPDFFFSATATEISYGTTSKIAGWLSDGTKKMVERPIYPDQLPPAVVARLLELLTAYVAGDITQ